MLAKVATITIAILYLVLGILRLLEGLSFAESFWGASNIVTVAIAALSLGIWILGSRCVIRDRFLVLVDGLLTLAYGVAIALISWLLRSDAYSLSFTSVYMTILVMTRAVVVPASARMTLAVSILAFVPHYVTSHMIWLDAEGWPGAARPSFSLFVVRSSLGIPLAVMASHVIFGLRRQVNLAQRLGQYRLEKKIGEGGMGEVYLASHAMLRRPTAIKLLRPELAGESNITRFEREVQMTSRLTHPNTVAIYDYGHTPSGVFYYAMEYLDGITLETLVRRHGPQPESRVIYIICQVCASLSEAHSIGLIHRDVKPSNIFLCCQGGRRDVVKLLDFGLVKDLSGTSDSSTSTTITGTPFYISPEAIRSPGKIGPSADLYALGAVAYWLVTGQRMFSAESVMDVFSDQLQTQPRPPSEKLGRPVSPDLEAVIMKCLEKEPGNRYATAGELSQALGECRDSSGWSEESAREWWETIGAVRESDAGVARQIASTQD